MKTYHLENPPIIESIIDFRLKTSPNFSIEKLEDSFKKIKQTMPEKHPIYMLEGHFKFGKDQATELSSKNLLTGFRFNSEDKKRIVQFRIDGFTYSHLEPYPGWDEVIQEAKALWEIYNGVSTPLEINRLAVRTINKIDFPCAQSVLQDYLKIYPKLPTTFPSLKNFAVTLQLSEENNINSIITIKTIDQSESIKTPILFDTDIYLDKISIDPNQTEQIWNTFAEIRKVKNKVFFESINNKEGNILK